MTLYTYRIWMLLRPRIYTSLNPMAAEVELVLNTSTAHATLFANGSSRLLRKTAIDHNGRAISYQSFDEMRYGRPMHVNSAS